MENPGALPRRGLPNTPRVDGPYWLSLAERSVQRILHRREGRLELRAQALNHRDDGDRDASRDQAVLDGRRAGLVFHEPNEERLHRSLPRRNGALTIVMTHHHPPNGRGEEDANVRLA